MVWVVQVKINSTDVVMVHSMLNVLKIVMSGWHTELVKGIPNLLLRVLEVVSSQIISMVQLLSERHLGHFIVDLG